MCGATSNRLQACLMRLLPSRVLFSKYTVVVNSILLLVSLGVYCFLARTKDMNSICTQKAVSTYSPIFDRLPIYAKPTIPDSTFWPHKNSLYSRPPSPEVDEAWRRISDERGFRLTRAEAEEMGKDVDTLWPWPSAGDEDVTYLAMVDVFHQIHCLDNLRRAAWPDYYGDLHRAYENHTFPFTDHLLHCQYILFQSLTCHADVDVYTFNKIRGFKGPFPDFELTRQCRNFDDLWRWKEENVADIAIDPQRTPEGIKELPAEGRAIPFPPDLL